MSSFKEKLRAGEPQFGMAYSWPCPGLIEATAKNFDFCWIDAQHGPWDMTNLVGAVRACDFVGRPALVRVADHTYGRIGQTLDMGPAGIILPCVETPEQAQAIVDACCFPPVGNRSFGGRRVIDLYARAYAEDPELYPLVFAQIETPPGLENIEKIAAMPGIDVLFFGPDDMKIRLGYPLSVPIHSPEVSSIAKQIAEAARRHGKFAMTAIGGAPVDIECVLDAGYQLVNITGDAGLLRTGAAKAAEVAAGVLKERAK